MNLIDPCGVIPVSLCVIFDGSQGDLSRGALFQKYDALHMFSGLDIIRSLWSRCGNFNSGHGHMLRLLCVMLLSRSISFVLEPPELVN